MPTAGNTVGYDTRQTALMSGQVILLVCDAAAQASQVSSGNCSQNNPSLFRELG
ncbi:hypothetical protein [Chloroflexus aurantiacus]